MKIITRASAILLALCFLLPLATPAPARAGEVKDSLKQAGSALKKLGQKVGEGGKEAGQGLAGVAKKVWYKGKQVSARLLGDVQRSTREFWEKSNATKDRTIDQLREENDRLKRRLQGAR